MIVIIVVELSLFRPPVGMNLFVIRTQVLDVPILSICQGTLAFLVAPIALIAMLMVFPQIALYLP